MGTQLIFHIGQIPFIYHISTKGLGGKYNEFIVQDIFGAECGADILGETATVGIEKVASLVDKAFSINASLGVVDKVHCATAERYAMRYLDEDMIEQGITLTFSSLINETVAASDNPDDHTALVYLYMFFVDMFREVSEKKRAPGVVVEDFYDMCMKNHQGMYIQTYKY